MEVGDKITAYIIKDCLNAPVIKVNAVIVRAPNFVDFYKGDALIEWEVEIEYRLPGLIHVQYAKGVEVEFTLTKDGITARQKQLIKRLEDKVREGEKELKRYKDRLLSEPSITDLTGKKRNKT